MDHRKHCRAAVLTLACLILMFGGCCPGGGIFIGFGGSPNQNGPQMMTPQPAPANVNRAPTEAPIEAPQARFHPVPVRPVFLPGSFAAPQVMQPMLPGTSPPLQKLRSDEPPPFPEPEQVGPPEPNVDGKMTQKPTRQHTATAAAWVFMPAAAETSAAEQWKPVDPRPVRSDPKPLTMSPPAEPLRLALPPLEQLRPALQPEPLDPVGVQPLGWKSPSESSL